MIGGVVAVRVNAFARASVLCVGANEEKVLALGRCWCGESSRDWEKKNCWHDKRKKARKFHPAMETYPTAFAQAVYFVRTIGTVSLYGQTTTLMDCRWLKSFSGFSYATMMVRVTLCPGSILVSGASGGCAPFLSSGKA